MQPIPVLHDGIPLDIIQNFPNLLRRVLAMIQERNEESNGALEIDVVLPERVIGINEQRLGAVLPGHMFNDSALAACGRSPGSYQGVAF